MADAAWCMAITKWIEDSSEDNGGLTRSVIRAIRELREADQRLHLAAPNSLARAQAELDVEGRMRDVRELLNLGRDSKPARAPIWTGSGHNRPLGEG
jgi:hypothetical protein